MKSNIKIILTLLTLASCSTFVAAQGREWKWARSSQNSATANLTTLSVDLDGNVYSGGNYAPNILSFGDNTIVNNSSGTNFFIVKSDAEGNVLWLRKATSVQCFLHSAATDSEGNVFGVGHFHKNITLGDISLSSPSAWCMVIFMMDKDGNYIWAKSVGESHRVTPSKIVSDSNGNLCIAGTFSCQSVAFDDYILNRVGIQDIFVAKYDNHGNVLWAKRAGSTSGQNANALAIDDSNNIFIAGDFTSSLTFGSSLLVSSGSADIFVAKYDTEGNEIWGISMGGSDYDTVSNISTDTEGNVIVAGDYYKDITIGTDVLQHSGQEGTSDIFIAKCDIAGAVVWSKSLQGELKDTCSGIATDALGNIHITGSLLSETLQIEGITLLSNATGYRQLYIAQFNPDGVPGWTENAGMQGNNHSAEILIDDEQNIVVAGFYNEILSFGNHTLNEPGNNVFIAKYGNTLLGTDAPTIEKLQLYPNPADDTIYLSTDMLVDGGYIIYDILGRIAQQGYATNGSITIDNLSDGLYTLRLSGFMSKFIKK